MISNHHARAFFALIAGMTLGIITHQPFYGAILICSIASLSFMTDAIVEAIKENLRP